MGRTAAAKSDGEIEHNWRSHHCQESDNNAVRDECRGAGLNDARCCDHLAHRPLELFF